MDVYRHFLPPTQSFFLFGPRGTGKTTWVKFHFPQALSIDLLDPEQLLLYKTHPSHLRQLLDARPHVKTVLIDEVQEAPEILGLIHQLIEEKRGFQFILTGSSSRKLKRRGVDLLAGRALLCHLHPFMASELGDAFSLTDGLRRGMLPLVWGAKEIDKTLRAYVGMYLKEEVQSERLVRNLGDFARFLEVMSFSQASLLNASNVARESGVGRVLVDGYIQLLEDMLLSYRLPVFTKRAKRAPSSQPKFYYFDVGVFRALRPRGPLDSLEELNGPLLESLVGQHLRAWCDYGDQKNELFFWRTKSGLEVDFIVYGEGGFWAIEVKNSEKVRPEDLKGLKAFGEDYPEAKLIYLSRGKDRLKRDDILFLPVDEFLKNLKPNQAVSPN